MKLSIAWGHVCVGAIGASVAAEPLGVPMTAVGWLVPLVGALGLLARRPSGAKFLGPWLPFIAYVAISVLLHDFENAAHRGAVLITPFFVGAATSTLPADLRTHRAFRRDLTFLSCVLLGCAVLAVHRTAAGDVPLLAPHAILAVLLFWYFFVEFVRSPTVGAALPCAMALAVPVLATSRTALAVIVLLCLLGVSGLGFRKRVAFGFSLGALAIGAFLTSAFREKMLLDPAAPLSLENIRTSGRSVAWGVLVDLIPARWVFGYGSNASEHYLAVVSEHFTHPHNDWLRLVFEYGVLGLLLFVFGVWRTSVGMSCSASRDEGRRRLAAFGLSMFGAMFGLMVTDNVILYAAFFGVLHFMSIGWVVAPHAYSVSVQRIAHRGHSCAAGGVRSVGPELRGSPAGLETSTGFARSDVLKGPQGES